MATRAKAGAGWCYEAGASSGSPNGWQEPKYLGLSTVTSLNALTGSWIWNESTRTLTGDDADAAGCGLAVLDHNTNPMIPS